MGEWCKLNGGLFQAIGPGGGDAQGFAKGVSVCGIPWSCVQVLDLLDFYGGAAHISLEDYWNADCH